MIPRCRPLAAAAVLAGVVAAGCGGDPDPGANPPRLWLALNGSEVDVRLATTEPPPY
jgi:hypothetical protein